MMSGRAIGKCVYRADETDVPAAAKTGDISDSREGEEGPDDNRVELRAAGVVEPAYRFLVWQAFAIGTRRNHGIESIDDADDP